MPNHFYKYCPDCHTRHNNAGTRCNKCQQNNPVKRAAAKREAVRKSAPVWNLYGEKWRQCKLALAAAGNVQCQRIINGVRCQQQTEVFHHHVSPKERPDLMYRVENIAGCCRQHHYNEPGTPEEHMRELEKHWAPTKVPHFGL
jgi:hypothetical protein